MMTGAFHILAIDLKAMLRSRLALFWTFVFPLLLLFAQTRLNGRSTPLDQADLLHICTGLVAIIVTSTTIMGFAAPLVQARETGILRGCLLWPLSGAQILAAMAGARLAVTLLASALLVTAAIGAGLAAPAAPLASVLVVIAAAAAFLAMALALGARGASTQSAAALCNMVYFAFIFCGEVFFDARHLPPLAAALLSWLPVNALVHALGAAWDGQSWPALLQPLAVLAGWGLACGLLAVRIFQWQAPRAARSA